MKRLLALATGATLLVCISAFAEDAPDLKDVKCPVSGKAASADHHVEYKKADVYFCCPNCPKAFEANTAKFAPKANKQLVQTEQAKQKACPFTGKPVTVKVGDNPEIGFCCKNCLGKYNSASEAEQLVLVFSDKAFEKGFEVKKEKEAK